MFLRMSRHIFWVLSKWNHLPLLSISLSLSVLIIFLSLLVLQPAVFNFRNISTFPLRSLHTRSRLLSQKKNRKRRIYEKREAISNQITKKQQTQGKGTYAAVSVALHGKWTNDAPGDETAGELFIPVGWHLYFLILKTSIVFFNISVGLMTWQVKSRQGAMDMERELFIPVGSSCMEWKDTHRQTNSTSPLNLVWSQGRPFVPRRSTLTCDKKICF